MLGLLSRRTCLGRPGDGLWAVSSCPCKGQPQLSFLKESAGLCLGLVPLLPLFAAGPSGL